MLALLVLGGQSVLAEQAVADPCDPPNNEVVCENSKAGTPSSVWDVEGAGASNIQGFATEISVDQGETIEFKVDTASTDYRLDIYRMGYYGGDGARKVGSVEPSATLPQNQPPCDLEPATGLVDCGKWGVSASWAVPGDAVSGIYFAKLEREDIGSEGSHIVFVVRDDDGESDLLFQTSDTTWQAYNEYGSNSLYTGSPGSSPGRAYKVSYNRPLTVRQTNSEDSPFNAEYPMVRWLERNGYDVSYSSGVDTDRAGEELLEHAAFLSVGHDEYWSAAQRANVEAARDAGVHLAFFSGNEIFWKTRWEESIDGSGDEYRTLVSYKETHADEQIDPEGPETWTGTWRDPRFSPPGDGGRPENELSGTAFMVNAGSAEIKVPAADKALRLWRDTDIATLEPGQTAILGENTLGYEWDEDLDNGFRPPGLIRLSSTTEEVPQKLLDHGDTYGPGTATHHLTLYRAASEALVFGAGTIQWAWGLDSEHDRGDAPPDARMQQATVNLFADMGIQPQTLQAGLVAATETGDHLPPNTTIAVPADEGEVELDEAVSISGTAGDSEGESEPGGEVGGVEVSVDGGETWHPAEGRENWTYTWFPEELGEATILARAADDSANLEDTPDEATVDVVPLTCPCSIWNDTFSGPQDPDTKAVELGVKLRSETAGYITGLRFYKTAGNTGTHTGRLWNAAGEQLATVTFSGETATGWQQATFDTPVSIAADTTYVASYHAPNGRYASVKSYFALTGFENPPLYALADDEEGPNGIYKYGAPGALFAGGEPDTFQAENYLVDVVFELDVGPDTTAPKVKSRSPVGGAEEIGVDTSVKATFDEPIDPATVGGATVQLRDDEGAPVAAGVGYNPELRQVTLDPSASLDQETTYTATLKGGPGGVADVAGNPLAADEEWSFTTATPPPPPPDQGPGGPILVISNSENPFSRYYGQILEAEGLNEYTVADISTVTPSVLEARDVAILGEGAVSGAQATMLSEWVQDGGNLIAMRPDPDLLGLLGLGSSKGTLGNAYVKVDTGSAPGAGIVGETIQFHGSADRYATAGAQTIATLYSDASTSTGDPAVTLRSVGANGGHAAAFTYDLARSVVYTRQGNPAWNEDERDGLGARRSDDLFFGAKAGDVQPDWIDFDKVHIPQADEQQHLLTNLVGEVNLDRKPLPRFWFLPRDEKAAVVMTGDDHAHNGSSGRFEEQKALSPPGCVVAEWECVRSTSYIYPNTPITDTKAAQFAAEGFELGLHPTTGCNNWDDQEELGEYYDEQLGEFAVKFPSLPPPATSRTHCIIWSDWASQPKVELERGIRLDTTYYYWPASWVQDRPGMFTGSGMPMRFADLDGSLIDVYQAPTQMTDESEQAYPFTSDALLDRALGPEGYYGVFTANMHTDKATLPESTAIMESALARDVPVVSARQMLTWLDGRNQSSFGSVEWEDDELSFEIEPGPGANGLRAMLPTESDVGPLATIAREGSPVETTTRTIKGVEYAFFDAEAGSYTASYVDASLPEISNLEATVGNDGTATVTWQTDEPADSRVDYGTNPASLELSATDPALVTSHSIELTGLDPDSVYHFRVSSADAESNTATEPEPLLPPQSFATPPAAPLLSATAPPSPANENAPDVVGSASAGSSVDIYATADCSGAPLAGGTAAQLEAGIEVTVADDSSTSFRATATSGAGTSLCSAPLAYLEDSIAPATQLTGVPPALADSAATTFAFTGEDPGGSGLAGFECKLDAGGFEACSSGIELTGLGEGAHKFEVRALDNAGNADGTPASHEWTVDSAAPETQITTQPAAVVNSAEASFEFEGDDGAGSGVAGFECSLDEAPFAGCASGIEYDELSEGNHEFEVRAIDQAGNVDGTPASHAWEVDLTAPAVQIDSGPEGLTADASPTFAFSSEPGATLQCSLDTGTPSFGPCSAAGSHTPAAPLGDGSYTFRVRAGDAATNQAVATRGFEVDATAPDTAIDTAPAALLNSDGASFEFSGDDAAGSGIAGFECKLDAGSFEACSSGIELAELSEGAHSFEVRAIDNAGNADASPAEHEWTVDLTAPAPAIDSLSKALLKAGETSEVSWHADQDGEFELRVGGADCETGTAIDSGPYTGAPAPAVSNVSAAQLAEGDNTLRLCLSDAAGNRGTATAQIAKDTIAPNTQIDSAPAALSKATAATFAFSGDDAGGSGIAGFECKLDAGSFEACASGIELAGLAEGAHSFEVRAVDNAGNTDASPAKHEWTVDSVAPDTQITAQPPAFDKSATANFSFTGSDPGGSGIGAFQCRRDSEDPEDWQPCVSPLKYTSLAQGPHTVEIRAIDKAGNADPSPATYEWTIDTIAPETQITAGPNPLVNSAGANFSFTGSDPGGSGVASFQCRRDSTEPVAWTACTSPHAYAELADGPHKVEVRAVDQAGNADPSPAAHTWTIDTTPPALAIESGPEGLTTDDAPTFAFAYAPAPGDTLECSIDSGEAAFGPCTTEGSHGAADPLANGPYTFRVRATDEAGNPAVVTRDFEVDATLPETEITLEPAALLSSDEAGFEFAGFDPEGAGVAGFECKLDGVAFTACTSPRAYTGLSEGSHVFEVRAVDVAGNLDPTPASYEWVVDTVAPNTQIDLKPALLADSSEAKFEFSGDDGAGSGIASFQCRRDSTEPAAWAPCTSPHVYTELAQGAHKFEVRAIDNAGNTDQSAASYEWQIDSIAPETQITAAPPALTDSAGATFEFTGSDPGGSGVASFQCRRDSTEPVGWQLCSSPRVYTSLAEGTHSFEVRAVDVAGSPDPTPASFEWVIDTKAPQTQVTVKPATLVNSTTAKFEFEGEDVLEGSGVASFQCRRDSTEPAAWAPCTSGIEYTGLAEGLHKFEVRAIDNAGNLDASPAGHEWTIDLTPPAVQVDSGPEGLTGDATPTFEFSSEPGASFQCSIDTGTPAFGSCSAAGSHTPAAPLSDGAKTFRVRATDAAGNQAVATRVFDVDATAPNTQIDLGPVALSNAPTAKFEFSGDDGAGSGVASFECKLDAGSFAACSSGIEPTDLSEGSHSFEVRAIDVAGNVDAGPAKHEWTVDLTPPAVSIDSGPEGPTINASPTFEFSSEPGASFECSIDQGTPTFGPCSGAGSHTPAEPLPNGAHTFRVRAGDGAGNQAAATRDFEVNTAVPETPQLESTLPASPANHNSPKAIGTAQAGTTVRIYESADCTGAPLATVSAAELEAGAEVSVADNSTTALRATATAPPENTSLCSEPLFYVEDSSAPDTQIDAEPAAEVNSAEAKFEFSGNDSGGSGVASFECRRDSTEASAWAPCSSGIEYTGLAEGAHKFEVRAIDQAGNIDATPASHEWTVDLTAPAVSVDTGPTGLTSDDTPTFTFSSEPGATAQCSIDTGTPAFGPCSGAGTHTPAAPLGDGPHTFRVRATDTAGNQATATRGFTVDATPPDTQIILKPASPAGSATAKFEFSGDDGTGSGTAAFQCRIDSTEASAWAPCSSGIEYTGLAEGSHKFEVRAIDNAANTDQSAASHEWTVDTAAPETQITAQPAAFAGGTTAKFEFDGDDGAGSGIASFECKLDAAPFATCTSGIEYAELAEGSHSFEVRAIDNAGNVDGSAAKHEWTVDTAAPDTAIDTAPAALLNSDEATFAFSGDDGAGSGIASFECKLDSGSFEPCESGIELTGLSEGAHKFEVRAIDNAGNVDGSAAKHEWTIDLTAPAPAIDSLSKALLKAGGTSELTWHGDENGAFELRAGGADCDSGAVLDSGPYSTQPAGEASEVAAAQLAEGANTLRLCLTDAAGNRGAATIAITKDTQAPETQIDDGPDPLVNATAAGFQFSGSDPDGSGVASFECKLDGGDFEPCESGIELTELSEGAHKFEVRAIDNAGNADQSAAAHEWEIDLTPPPVSVDTGPEGLTNDPTPTFGFGSEPGASFQCSIDQGEASFEACSAAASHAPEDPLADGPYTFRVRATDAAGNAATATREFEVDTAAPPAPELEATAPPSPAGDNTPLIVGTAEPGTTVRLYAGPDCDGDPIATVTPAELQAGVEATVANDSSTDFRATATTAALNTSGCSAPLVYVEDSTEPQTWIDAAPAVLVKTDEATFDFSGSDPDGSGIASFECKLDSGSFEPCESGIELSELSEGTHKFEVRAIDNAGNVDQSAASHEWEIDLTPPPVSVDTGPEGLINDPTPTFGFSSEPGATLECSIDGGTPDFGPCSDAGSHTPASALGDGSLTFRVRATDAAGNAATATREFEVDATAPQTQITLDPGALASSDEAKFEFSGDDGSGSGVASFECRRDSTEPGAWTACGSPQVYSELAEGSHEFEVRATDNAGNTDQSAAGFEWTVDTAAPDTQVDAAPETLAGSDEATFDFSGSDPDGSGIASFECKLDDGGFAACESGIELTGLSDGPHKFEVRAIDNAGNVDQSAAAHEWEIDLTPPAVSVDTGPEGLTNDPTPTFAFSSEPGASFQCSIDGGEAAFGACSGAGEHTPAEPLSDGPYSFRVRATDAAGNSATATREFEVDSVTPEPPELESTLPSSPANHNTPKVIGTAEPGTTVRLYAGPDCGGAPIATVTPAELEAGVEATVADDSTTAFRATATTAAENTSGCSDALVYVEDSTDPETQIDAQPAALVKTDEATFGFSGSDPDGSGIASFQCKLDSGSFEPCESGIELSELSEGTHKFEVRAIDNAGNADQSAASHSWTIDTEAPDTQIDTVPAALVNADEATFGFSGSDPGGSGIASFECKLDSGSFEACESGIELTGLSDGPHKFEVRAIDNAGNADQSAASYEWDVDTVAPVATIDDQPPALVSNKAAQFKFSATDDGSGVASFQCRNDSTEAADWQPCVSPRNYSGLADDSHSFEVRATDNAGNVGSAAGYEWEIDTKTPETQIDTAPAALLNSAEASFGFSGSDPEGSGVASFECKLDGGSFEACESAHEFTELSEGAHTFEVRAIDNAGNTDGSAAKHEWTVDTTAPAVSVDTGPEGLTNNPSPTFGFGSEPGATVQCSIDQGEASFEACSAAGSHTPAAPLADGEYSFRVRASDAAGNAATQTRDFELDATAPQTQIDAQPAVLVKTDEATFAFSGSDPDDSGVAAFQCKLDEGSFEACESGLTLTGLSEGSHKFEVRAIDNAGNADGSAAKHEWTVDTAAPDTVIDTAPAALLNSDEATFAFSGTDPDGSGIASFECKLDSGSFEPCESGIELTGLSEGAHKFEVRAIDNAGNTDGSAAKHEWTIDLTAPAPAIDSLSKALLKAGGTSELTWHGDENGSFELRVGGADCDSGAVLDSGAYGTQPATKASNVAAAQLPEGESTLRLCLADAAGNRGEATTTIVKDTEAPDTWIDTAPAALVNADEATFGFSGSDPDGSGIASFECKLDSGDFEPCESGIELTELSEGAHKFEVRAIDNAGNADQSTAAHEWEIDLTPPPVSVDTGPEGLTNDPTPTFGFGSEPGASFQCSIDQGEASFEACSAAASHAPEDPLADGPYTFRVRATDAAGNAATQTRDFELDATAPQTQIDDAPAAIAGSDEATFAFSGSDPDGSGIASFECKLDSGSFEPCESGIELTGLSEGAHKFEVRAIDNAGNVDGSAAKHEWTVDTVAPTAQIDTAPAPVSASSGAKFAFSGDDGSGSGVASFQCRNDSTEPVDWQPCTSPRNYAGLADGAHSFEARAIDNVGNVGGAAAYAWEIDTMAPQTRIDLGPSGTVDSSTATFGFSGTDDEAALPDDAFECSLDSSAWIACKSPEAYVGLSDGAHGFEVRAVDAAGNADPSPAARSWTIDTGEPPSDGGGDGDDEPDPAPATSTAPIPAPAPAEPQFVRVVNNARKGTALLVFELSSPGLLSAKAPEYALPSAKGAKKSTRRALNRKRIRILQRSIRPKSVRVAAPGQAMVPVVLSGAGKKLLNRRGRLKIRVVVRFYSAAGPQAKVWKLAVTLKKRKAGRGKAAKRKAKRRAQSGKKGQQRGR